MKKQKCLRSVADPVKLVYISIGKSDDKLPQAGWSNFVEDVDAEIRSYSRTIHGMWFSLPQGSVAKRLLVHRNIPERGNTSPGAAREPRTGL